MVRLCISPAPANNQQHLQIEVFQGGNSVSGTGKQENEPIDSILHAFNKQVHIKLFKRFTKTIGEKKII